MLPGLLISLLLCGDTVSVRRLAIPQKAIEQYEEAQRKLARRDREGADKSLRKAVELAPDYADAWNALGVVWGSEDYFRRALQADEGNSDAALNLGALLLKTGRAEAALVYSQRAAHALPRDAAARGQLGMNLYQLGRLEAAEAELAAAKRLDPRSATLPQLFLAEIYARRGEKARALLQIDELLARGDSPELTTTLRNARERLR